MHRLLRAFANAASLTMTVLVPSAAAQNKNICLPEAVGLPSLGVVQMNTGPNWWGSISQKMTRLDDPRWNGAVSQDFNGEVTFRALHRSGTTIDTLFLSWTAKIDEVLNVADIFSVPPSGDQLIVGFKQSGGDTISWRYPRRPAPNRGSVDSDRSVGRLARARASTSPMQSSLTCSTLSW